MNFIKTPLQYYVIYGKTRLERQITFQKCPGNKKVKTKMDTKYTNRVPESRSFGSPGVLRVSGVSNHVLYLYLQLSDRLPWVSSTGIDKMHKSQIEKRKRNV